MHARYLLLTGCLGAGLAAAQATDPHENPAIQNAPDSKKIPPPTPSVRQTEAPAVPQADRRQVVSGAPVASSPAPADPEEVMLGEWNLVPLRSTFLPGPPPKAESRRYERTASGIVATIIRVEQDGSRTEISYPWVVDGSEHQIAGSGLGDMIQLQQIDNLTAEATLRHAGKTLATERRSISVDGRSMTIVITDRTSEERLVNIRAVYEKVVGGLGRTF